jgi:hypothetical protein
VAHQQVINPPAWAWCGAATMALCGERGDTSFIEKLLSGKRHQGDREFDESLGG